MGLFQIVQKEALQLSAAVRIGRGSADLLEGQAQVALEHLHPKGLRPTEKALSQALNLPDAELFATKCRHELVDVRRRL